jgi:hypothetical protein
VPTTNTCILNHGPMSCGGLRSIDETNSVEIGYKTNSHHISCSLVSASYIISRTRVFSCTVLLDFCPFFFEIYFLGYNNNNNRGLL